MPQFDIYIKTNRYSGSSTYYTTIEAENETHAASIMNEMDLPQYYDDILEVDAL